MYKKMIIIVLLFLGFCNLNVDAKEIEYRYEIIGDSTDIYQIYEEKQEIINNFQELTKGVDTKYFDQILSDYASVNDNYSYENGMISVVLGDGEGKQIEGELKQDYCSNEEIETKVFLFEIFK